MTAPKSPPTRAPELPSPQSEITSTLIRLAWKDRCSFDEIRERTGLAEKDVIQIMRRELKPSSFRLWRKRVHGRITKHRTLLKAHLRGDWQE